MLPVCGFGPYQLAEADLNRSQNKQSVGGNSYTSDIQLFSKDNVWHIHNIFFVWGFGHIIQSLAEPPVLLLGESEEDRDVQLCSHESNGTYKWKSEHDVDELYWLIIPVKHSVL